MRNHWTSLLNLVLLLLAAAGLCASASGESAEDEMKAAVVLGFLRYSQWSDSSHATGPMVVGVWGRSTFAAVLKRSLDGKSANGRPIRVVEWNATADPRTYNIVFVAASGATDTRLIARLTSGTPAPLTIGDAPDFLDAGGAIRLMLIDGRMSFELRMDALEHSGVNVSSKLLRFGHVRKPAGRTS